MASILSGRILADVEVRSSPSATVTATVTLIVDTGAEASALPLVSMPAAVSRAPASRPITFYIAGISMLTFRRSGTIAETDVEPHGGGATTKAISRNIRVHSLSIGTAPFVGFDGIVGMDMLDDFAADPVKDKAATRAYLASRV